MSGRDHRFATGVLLAMVASLVLLSVLLVTTTSPREAREAREVPVLPPPTMAAVAGSEPGTVLVPRGAIATGGAAQKSVIVWTEGQSREVPVSPIGSPNRRLVVVRAEELQPNDQIELITIDEAAPPPPGSPG